MASVRIGGARVDITGQSTSLEKAMRRAAAAYDRQEKDLKRLRGQARRTGRSYDALAAAAKRVGPIAATALGGFGLASAVKTIATFEQSIADLSAITGAAGKDLRELEKASLDLAGSSTYTGGQVADAFKLVASAKPDLLESTKALTEVTAATLTLAEAAGIQLTEAAVAVGGTLNQFALASSEAGRVVNVLAAGSKFGAASISEIAMAMKEFGVDAAGAGISVEEATAAVEALAAVNIKGSQAGTALRNIINRLDTHIDRDLRPSVVGLTGAFENLNRKGLDGQAILKLFGLENVTTGKYLIGNVDLIRKLTEQLTGTNIAYEQAAIRTDTLQGKAAILASAWERFLNVASDSGPWQRFLDSLADAINKTSDLIEKSDELEKRGATPSGAATGMRFGWAQAEHLSGQGAAVLGNLLTEYETLSRRVTELGVHATQHQLDRLDALQERIDRINAAGPVALPPYAGHVDREAVAPAVVPDEPRFYTDPYGPRGLEKTYEQELDLLGVLEDQKERDILRSKQQAEARAAAAAAAEVEATALRNLERAYFELQGDAVADREETGIFEERKRMLADYNAAHEKAVADRLKVEEAAREEVFRQAEAVRDAQIKAAKDAQTAWENMATSIGDHFATAFGQFATGAASAKDAFRQFASGVIQEMIRIQAQAAAAKLLSFLGNLFIAGAPSGWRPTGAGNAITGYGLPGARAGGGPVGAGRAYVVGEEGPELFVPDRSGSIVPNGKMGSVGGTSFTQINQVEVRGDQNKAMVMEWVAQALAAAGVLTRGELIGDTRYPTDLDGALARGARRG